MLPLIARGLRASSGASRAGVQALQAQQKRYLNIHEYQGAQLMAKFGINVPDGVAASTVDEVARAAEAMKDAKGEVRRRERRSGGGGGRAWRGEGVPRAAAATRSCRSGFKGEGRSPEAALPRDRVQRRVERAAHNRHLRCFGSQQPS